MKKLKLTSTTALVATALLVSVPACAENPFNPDSVSSNVTADISDPDVTHFEVDGGIGSAIGNADIGFGQVVNVEGINGARRFSFTDNRDNIQSTLDGKLNSNIQVIVIDKDGLFFTDNAVINVQSIIATSANVEITSNSFGDDKIKFKKIARGGAITNNGSITVAEAGLAAFVSPFITHNGTINAKVGDVVMAAGKSVTLDFVGDDLLSVKVKGDLADALIENNGEIRARGGNVEITARVAKDIVDNVVNNNGLIQASSAVVGEGGEITLLGYGGTISNNGTIKTSSGGNIHTASERFVQGDAPIPGKKPQIKSGGGNIKIETNLSTEIYAGKINAQGGDIELDNSGVFYSAESETLKTKDEGEIVVYQNQTPLIIEDPEDEIFDDNIEFARAFGIDTVEVEASIQNAIDAIDNSGAGSNTINVGAGTFNESVDVDHDNLVLNGNNARTLGSPNRQAETIIRPNSPGFYVTADNTTIDGFRIIGDGTDRGIFVDGAQHTIVANNVISRVSDGVFADQAHYTSVEFNNIRANAEGIYLEKSDYGYVGFNRVRNTGSEGIYLRNSDYALVEFNTVRNAGLNGIRLNIANRVEAQYNTVIGSRFDGIRIENGILADVHHNISRDSGSDGIEAVGNNGLKLYNNRVRHAAQDGIEITTRDADGTYVAHNNVAYTGGNGIAHKGPDGITIEYNRIREAGENGIYSSTVNSFPDDNYDGFPDENRKITIAGNRIIDSVANGILVEDTINFPVIEDNRVRGTGEHGIYLERTDYALVYDNKVSDTDRDGIYLRSSDDSIVMLNRVYGIGENGIRVNVSNNSFVAFNRIYDTRFDGIRLENGTNGGVFGNVLWDNGSDGIEAVGVNRLNIVANKVTDAHKHGISVITRDQAGTYVGYNRVTGTGQNGIRHEGLDSIFIERNRINNTGTDGIYSSTVSVFNDVPDGSIDARDPVRLLRNRVTNAGTNGVFVEKTENVSLVRNKINSAGDDGIHVEDSGTIRLRGNDIVGLGGHGVYARGVDRLILRNNTITDSVQHGLFAAGEENGLIRLRSNVFTNNDGQTDRSDIPQARFESGDIDLSGVENPNSFISTSALPSAAIELDDVSASQNSLSVVGNTLGGTIFEGYTPEGSLYVSISDGTLLDSETGEPIEIDGTSASFDGTITGGGIIPLDVLSPIEDRLFDADDIDLDGRGQIFVGDPPPPPPPLIVILGIDNTQDFIQNPDTDVAGIPITSASLRVNGLPPTGQPQAAPQPPTGLNNIAPQAGADAEQVADIRPEAGEQTPSSDVTCATDLGNALSSGSVTYNFGGTFEDGIAGAARCGA